MNIPSFIHALGGNSVTKLGKYKNTEVINSQNSLKFTLNEPSLLNLVVEVPKGLKGEGLLRKAKSEWEVIASSDRLNEKDDTFLHKKEFQHASYIVFREFLDPGEYIVNFDGSDLEEV